MQIKSWKYMLQTSENYNKIQEPTKKKKKKNWKMFYNTNCETEYIVYLMDCIICNLQYVREN